MENKIGFSYGIFADGLEKQANDQGYTLGDKVDTFEKIRKAINMCGFHVATDSQVNSMFIKLNKKITDSLIKLN